MVYFIKYVHGYTLISEVQTSEDSAQKRAQQLAQYPSIKNVVIKLGKNITDINAQTIAIRSK